VTRQAHILAGRAQELDQRETQLKDARATLERDRVQLAQQATMQRLGAEQQSLLPAIENQRKKRRVREEAPCGQPDEMQHRTERLRQREAEAERLQRALQRRTEEIDRLEARIHAETAAKEKELDRERLELDRQTQQLRLEQAWAANRLNSTINESDDRKALTEELAEARYQVEQLQRFLYMKRQENKSLRQQLDVLSKRLNQRSEAQERLHRHLIPSDPAALPEKQRLEALPVARPKNGSSPNVTDALRLRLAALENRLNGQAALDITDTPSPSATRPGLGSLIALE
jgi:chromosome segregation ATPase